MRRTMKLCVWATLFIFLGAVAGGCSARSEEKKPAEKALGKPPVAVEATKATASDVVDGIDVIGSISPKFGADVKSEYTGIVTEVFVTEWVKVKKGDPLARLDTREMDVLLHKNKATAELAKANLSQAEVAEHRAAREDDRASKLKEAGLITQQNLDDARTEREAAKARIEAARAQLKVAEEDVQQAQTRLSKSLIRSPIEGVVYLRNVNVGDFVGEMGGKPMFRIVDNRVLELTVNVPSGDMAALRVGQPLTFSTDALPGRVFTGKVMFINPTVNEADRSVRVIAEVENKDDSLKGGLFVKGRILTGKRTGVVKVPRTALLTWDVSANQAEIFVVNGDIARRQAVRTGNLASDRVEITAGVTPGQMVITRGGFNVKDGDKVNVTRIDGEK
ncbi:MAG TPA: efflux RND transporter periplasmic adaptor subunit [Candidatus Acidoferrum sp.]|nr:efflux RND transporter periplasmic adaptor subunit [Candidatus Acidoferrum sp.]